MPHKLQQNQQVRMLDVLVIITLAATLLFSVAVLRFQQERRAELIETVGERNGVRMNTTAQTVTEYFDSVRTILQVISRQPDILNGDPETQAQIAGTYDILWSRHRVTSLLITPVVDDEIMRPSLHLTHQGTSPVGSTDGSLPNELHVLDRQRLLFDADRDLESLLSGPIELCGNSSGKPRVPGYVFTTPVQGEHGLMGMATLTIPVELISSLLERGSEGCQTVLVNQNSESVTCENFPEDLHGDVKRVFEATTPKEYFAGLGLQGNLLDWVVLWRPIEMPDSKQWWLIHIYDEELELSEIGRGFETRAKQSIVIILIVGTGLAVMLVAYRSRLQARLEFLRERAKDDELLHSVAMGTSGATGEEFFRVLSHSLAAAFDVRYAHVSSLDESDRLRARTLAFWDGQDFRPTIHYDIPGSPSELILKKGRYQEVDGLDQRFDHDSLLHELGVRSYVGTTLYDSEGEPFGVLVIMDTKPFGQPKERVDSILQIYAARASAELIRLRSDRRILEMNENLERQFATRSAELRTAQHQLVEAEKMAALGTLVAGIAHEINGPVGIGVTAVTHLQDQARSFQKELENGQLTRQQLRVFLDGVNESMGLVYSNLRRAADLIRIFKQVSADGEGEKPCLIRVKDHVNQALLDLQPALSNGRHSISVTCPEEFETVIYPNAFRGVIAELVKNTLQHGFSGMDGGFIRIEVADCGPSWRLLYSDNGCGMDRTTAQRIYDPFYTTNRGRHGTGLGMHILYNTVTRTMGGTIHCESSLGDGVRFEIVCPELTTASFAELAVLVS